ncbi:MAG: divalent metal cation transporter [Bacteroidales bacterium]
MKILGPGLLYAGAAVGVSHLVQSTRAGATYGFELAGILLLANAIKYPFFEFGPRYAAATGKSLIEGYKNSGRWSLILFALLTVGTMFTIQAAVTIVTAALIANVFNLQLSPVTVSAVILAITMLLLISGRYSVIDRVVKFVIVLLALSTIAAVLFAWSKGYHPDPEHLRNFEWGFRPDWLFLIAFVGWMPAPIDVTVWQSLWTNAKYAESNSSPRMKDVLLDFRIGYIGTALLALGFLALGAFVLYGTGEELSPKGSVFAGQFINMYTTSIGSWAYPIIAIAAITTMFSTTLTCLDAYPRVMKPLRENLFNSGSSNRTGHAEQVIWLVITAGGALVVMSWLASTMQTMVDIATTLSFVTAPVLAFLNLKAVLGKEVPDKYRPGKGLRIYAWIGIVFLAIFTLVYFYWVFL